MNNVSEATPFVADEQSDKMVSQINLNGTILLIKDSSVDKKIADCKNYTDEAIKKAIIDAMLASY